MAPIIPKKRQKMSVSPMQSRFEELSAKICQCERCPLYRGIREYVPGILGREMPKVVFVGEAPGAMEDITGEPFKGQSGTILSAAVWEFMGLKRGDYTILNSVKCRPPQNRDPADREKKACRPWLLEQLRIIKPTVIVPLGAHGSHAVLGERRSMGELREICFKVDGHNCDVVPTYHPMATAYAKERRAGFEEDLRSILAKRYRETRQRGRCSIPIDAPQSLDGGGVALS